MELWVIFVLLYGIIKGTRAPIKKAILADVNVLSALFGYTFIGFLVSALTVEGVFSFTPSIFVWVIVKSLAVFFAWILSFKSIKKVPVSIYGVFDMSRVVFSILFGILFLHESLTVKTLASLLLIILGLYFVNKNKAENKEEYNYKYIVYILLSCFFNSVSGTLDKYIMSTGEITSSALQFWFMLLLSVFYLLYILIKREKFEVKKSFTNPWLYVISLLLVIGDRLLFIANSDPSSQVVTMTIIKQVDVVVTILLGKLIYKEKNIIRKLACAFIIIVGIVLSVM